METLYYESITGMYFTMTEEEITKKMTDLENMRVDNPDRRTTVNDYLGVLDMPNYKSTRVGDILGWKSFNEIGHIGFHVVHRPTVDNKYVLAIEMMKPAEYF